MDGCEARDALNDDLTVVAGREEAEIANKREVFGPENLGLLVAIEMSETALTPEGLSELARRLARFAWGYCRFGV